MYIVHLLFGMAVMVSNLMSVGSQPQSITLHITKYTIWLVLHVYNVALIYYSIATCSDISMPLCVSQILKMLEAMGFGKYLDIFSSQQVNGDILLECDDKMLE